MTSPPRTPEPPAQADRRHYRIVFRRFDGSRSPQELVRSLLAAHMT